jgi:hypothetical protein
MRKKRLVNNITRLVNLLILTNFLSLRFASDPNIWNLNLTTISWTVFIAVLILANVWLYYSYYKKPKNVQ